ncbi:hypothetical protein INR49_007084 [Caranx melampygus]|nr:hypothetical protein INR49_007084 [Caranx melampygus]
MGAGGHRLNGDRRKQETHVVTAVTRTAHLQYTGHVFQIDPNTKKNWVPTSKHAAIINSTITPNMTFTKTSQKLVSGRQPSEHRVRPRLLVRESPGQDKFAEFKEAARLAKEKSQEKMELTSTPSSSSSINKHWEAELAALKGNNAKMTAALLESTANVTGWSVAGATQREVESAAEFQAQRDSLSQKLQDTEARNQTLEAQLSDLEQRLESSQQEREAFRKSLRSLLELLDSKIFELTELRDTLTKLIEGS